MSGLCGQSRRPAPGSHDELHRRLASFNTNRFTPALPCTKWRENMAQFSCDAEIEREFLESARAGVQSIAAQAPIDAHRFIEWFENLKEIGPGQNDPLFPWLADHANLDEMKWFLTQEVAGEAGFDDLTAITQVRLPQRTKLELARNYWDEMGRGKPKGMHGSLLETLTTRLELKPCVETTVWESLALANTMAGLAANRCYAFHSVGALGVIEMTAPDRAAAVAHGLKRLGIPAADRHYFDLHSILDVKHSKAWNAEVIRPLVDDRPDVAAAIGEGALMRLDCGRRCFQRYRQEFGLTSDAA